MARRFHDPYSFNPPRPDVNAPYRQYQQHQQQLPPQQLPPQQLPPQQLPPQQLPPQQLPPQQLPPQQLPPHLLPPPLQQQQLPPLPQLPQAPAFTRAFAQIAAEGPIGNILQASPGFGEETDLPLLEELGIDPKEIGDRLKATLLFRPLDSQSLESMDMCGPVIIAACAGASLLLAGKTHFGYVYGLSVTGSLCMWALLNLMARKDAAIDLHSTGCVLGYGLAPAAALAAVRVVFSFDNLPGAILCVLTVLWCTATASRWFEAALRVPQQRFLIAYPAAIFYACFVLIAVF